MLTRGDNSSTRRLGPGDDNLAYVSGAESAAQVLGSSNIAVAIGTFSKAESGFDFEDPLNSPDSRYNLAIVVGGQSVASAGPGDGNTAIALGDDLDAATGPGDGLTVVKLFVDE